MQEETMPTENPHATEIKVEEYLPMLRRLAWSFNRTTGLPYESLISAAYETFAWARNYYNPERGKFSTLLYHTARTRLIDYCADAKRWRNGFQQPMAPDLMEAALKLNPESMNIIDNERKTIFKDALEKSSEEVKYMAWMIFQSPGEFLGYGGRGRVKDKLRELGWTWDQIWRTFREVKDLLKETV